MKKSTRIILVALILLKGPAYSQGSVIPENQIFENSINNFENCIIKYYQPDKNQIKQLCENACIFIRFKVLKDGTISDLEFSRNTIGFSPHLRNTPPVITQALTKAFKETGSHFISFKALQSDNRTYLLPFIYYYNTGCYAQRYQENEKLLKTDTTYKMATNEQQGNTILNILNFTNNGSNSSRYTILKSIKVGKKNKNLFF